MRSEIIPHLVTAHGAPYRLGRVDAEQKGEIEAGELVDERTGSTVPILRFVPRFRQDEGYAANFGEQWNRYRSTQLDSRNGTTLSADRFYSGTGWTRAELAGERILEVGCGAGRFTEVMLAAGAEVFSIDYSSAVDACWGNNGPHPRLTVAQADLFALPFRPGSFDRVFCYGVLQHTPDPRAAFVELTRFVKPGGRLAVDVYVKQRWPTRWTSKNLWRPITRRMPPQLLRRIVEAYVPRWLPVDERVRKIRKVGRVVTGIVPCWNYGGLLPLTPAQLREWAILDTYDALSARYDYPQTVEEVRTWFEAAGLSSFDVRPGGNGILGNAVR